MKRALKWGAVAFAVAAFTLPTALAIWSTRQGGVDTRAALEQARQQLHHVEELDATRSRQLAAAAGWAPGGDVCAQAPAVANPPLNRSGDVGGQLWRVYVDQLTSQDSIYEIQGSTGVGLEDEPGGPRLRNVRSTVATVESLASQGSVGVTLPKLPAAADWKRDVTIMLDQYQAPEMKPGAHEFEAGRASGKAYLYDYDSGAIVCVGRFEATNSDSFEALFQREGDLEFTSDIQRDLRLRIIVQAVLSLRAPASVSPGPH